MVEKIFTLYQVAFQSAQTTAICPFLFARVNREVGRKRIVSGAIVSQNMAFKIFSSVGFSASLLSIGFCAFCLVFPLAIFAAEETSMGQ